MLRITADKPTLSKHRLAATECRQPSSVWSLAARILRSSRTCARNTASIHETPVSEGAATEAAGAFGAENLLGTLVLRITTVSAGAVEAGNGVANEQAKHLESAVLVAAPS